MRIAHFDCFSGISGDMVLGAVIDAGVNPALIRAACDSLSLPIRLEIETVKRCGFVATKATVIAQDQEDYRFLPDVEAILAKGALSPRQRDLATTIFRKVAEAEAKVHGMPLERVHFHEVGALDSIADIVGAAVGLDALGVERFTSSPVAVGSGTVKCAHGIMPVPTPGTAELLKGVPLAKCPVKGELTTPTGAAILTAVVSEFVDSPQLTIERIGHGSGTKDFIEQPNILRLLIGSGHSEPRTPNSTLLDTVVVLETNLDDVSPEVIGYCTERLFHAGALDVFVVQGQMKKGRPGFQVSVICEPARVPELESVLFRETATLGIRKTRAERTKLNREIVTVETLWGPVAAKRGWANGEEVLSPEFEACAKVAREHGVPLREVYEAVISRAGRGG
ncbi:MAG TPA: nickel pincer cofactor biosynthesis protein LarC [Fimbriiglobus sp.]